jgi:hypothetical protein
VQGEEQKPLDVASNEMLMRQTEWSGHLAGMASEEMDSPYQIPGEYPRGKYLLVFDPLDGSSNIDVNVSVGTIFSILRAPQDVIDSGRDVTEAGFLQPGAPKWPRAMRLYGPTTMLVLTVGNGVVGFTLDPNLGEYMLTHPNIQCARRHARNLPSTPATPLLGSRRSNVMWTNAWPERPAARQGLQHALDRLDGGRSAPHPDAWRRVHVPARHQGPEQGRASASALRSLPHRFHHGAGRWTRQHRPRADSECATGRHCTSASGWYSARATKSSASSATTPNRSHTPIPPIALFR